MQCIGVPVARTVPFSNKIAFVHNSAIRSNWCDTNTTGAPPVAICRIRPNAFA
jgi:hypothetical protein